MVIVWRIADDFPNSPNFSTHQGFPLYGIIEDVSACAFSINSILVIYEKSLKLTKLFVNSAFPWVTVMILKAN